MILNIQSFLEDVYNFFADTDWGLVAVIVLAAILLFEVYKLTRKK